MAALNKGKHIVEEIDGVRCTVVEKGIDEKRMQFLKAILEYNKLTVKTLADATANTYTLGVTDIKFNPVIAIYSCALKTQHNKTVTPFYWNQWTTKEEGRYWMYRH